MVLLCTLKRGPYLLLLLLPVSLMAAVSGPRADVLLPSLVFCQSFCGQQLPDLTNPDHFESSQL